MIRATARFWIRATCERSRPADDVSNSKALAKSPNAVSATRSASRGGNPGSSGLNHRLAAAAPPSDIDDDVEDILRQTSGSPGAHRVHHRRPLRTKCLSEIIVQLSPKVRGLRIGTHAGGRQKRQHLPTEVRRQDIHLEGLEPTQAGIADAA